MASLEFVANSVVFQPEPRKIGSYTPNEKGHPDQVARLRNSFIAKR
jgi:hypothetical protein